MRTLLKNARLVDPEAETEATGWLLIEDDMIAALGTGAAPAGADVEHVCNVFSLSPGIVDFGV